MAEKKTRRCLLSVSLTICLVDTYAKHGCLKQAKYVFDMTLTKELLFHNAILSAYALHGYSKDALYKHVVEEDTNQMG